MQTISEIFDRPIKRGDVGIEVEVEGENLQFVDTKLWETVSDGSLRGDFPTKSCEFVLVNPIPLRDVPVALTDLAGSQAPATFKFSFRTSVHVHLNVGALTDIQLANVVYTYLLLEEPLLNFCGKSRKGNRFCLRVQDAEELILHSRFLLEKGAYNLIRNTNENMLRYGSINLASIGKYQSLEFRGMRGTLDSEVLVPWIFALSSLKTWASQQKDPWAILQAYVNKGGEAFLKEVLGSYADKFLYARAVKDMDMSLSLTMDLPQAWKMKREKASFVSDYKRVKAKIQRERPPPQELDWAVIDPLIG